MAAKAITAKANLFEFLIFFSPLQYLWHRMIFKILPSAALSSKNADVMENKKRKRGV
jgi:magnesium-transporting ATPase (P-type)